MKPKASSCGNKFDKPIVKLFRKKREKEKGHKILI